MQKDEKQAVKNFLEQSLILKEIKKFPLETIERQNEVIDGVESIRSPYKEMVDKIDKAASFEEIFEVTESDTVADMRKSDYELVRTVGPKIVNFVLFAASPFSDKCKLENTIVRLREEAERYMQENGFMRKTPISTGPK